MNKLILFTVFIFLVSLNFLKAQSVKSDSAKYFEGKTITVCGAVVGTHVSNGEKKTTILNIDKPYPETQFTVVIFEDDLPNFKFIPSEFYKGKKLCVSGKIKIFKNKPEIIVNSPDQIKIEQ